MQWNYQDKIIQEISDLPEGAFGFIYQTTHLPTGKRYIGKKSLIYNLKKKLGKKEKALWEGKGRPPVYKRVLKESDWKTYYGSHGFIIREIVFPVKSSNRFITPFNWGFFCLLFDKLYKALRCSLLHFVSKAWFSIQKLFKCIL